eukprot:767537-Hanusia_phi.AAC.1
MCRRQRQSRLGRAVFHHTAEPMRFSADLREKVRLPLLVPALHLLLFPFLPSSSPASLSSLPPPPPHTTYCLPSPPLFLLLASTLLIRFQVIPGLIGLTPKACKDGFDNLCEQYPSCDAVKKFAVKLRAEVRGACAAGKELNVLSESVGTVLLPSELPVQGEGGGEKERREMLCCSRPVDAYKHAFTVVVASSSYLPPPPPPPLTSLLLLLLLPPSSSSPPPVGCGLGREAETCWTAASPMEIDEHVGIKMFVEGEETSILRNGILLVASMVH